MLNLVKGCIRNICKRNEGKLYWKFSIKVIVKGLHKLFNSVIKWIRSKFINFNKIKKGEIW